MLCRQRNRELGQGSFDRQYCFSPGEVRDFRQILRGGDFEGGEGEDQGQVDAHARR